MKLALLWWHGKRWEFVLCRVPAYWLTRKLTDMSSSGTAYRIVTVESAREDYGVKVPS